MSWRVQRLMRDFNMHHGKLESSTWQNYSRRFDTLEAAIDYCDLRDHIMVKNIDAYYEDEDTWRIYNEETGEEIPLDLFS